MRALATLLLAASLGPVSLAALQDTGPPVAAFEVVSIRHNTSGDNMGFPSRWTPGRYSAINTRLDSLVLEAFGIPRQLAHHFVVGGLRPDVSCTRNCSSREEVLGARFDIQATLPEGVPQSQQRSILRALLEDRFTLKARLETRNIPSYALTIARDGQLGPQLRRSDKDCDEWARARRDAAPGVSVTEPADAQGRPLCSIGQMSRLAERIMVIRYAGDFSILVNAIRQASEIPVVDRTGLTGRFEFDLTIEWPGMRQLNPDIVVKAPTLDVAVREQLGLRLERITSPQQVLIIDSVAMPAPN